MCLGSLKFSDARKVWMWRAKFLESYNGTALSISIQTLKTKYNIHMYTLLDSAFKSLLNRHFQVQFLCIMCLLWSFVANSFAAVFSDVLLCAIVRVSLKNCLLLLWKVLTRPNGKFREWFSLMGTFVKWSKLGNTCRQRPQNVKMCANGSRTGI